MGKITPFKTASKWFSIRGFQLDKSDYKGSDSKCRCICPNGHEWYVKPNQFRLKNYNCPYCSGVAKKTYEEVKYYFENLGFTLLSTEYVNNISPLLLKCSNGHVFKKRLNNFVKRPFCTKCYREEQRLKKQTEIKIFVENIGYEMLDEYKSSKQKFRIRCPKGHVTRMNYGNLKIGHRCSTCYGNTKKTLEDVVQYFDSQNYTITSTEYTNSLEHVEYICPNGHYGSMSWSNFNKGHRCPKCVKNTTSNAEIEIYDFMTTLLKGIDVLNNDKKVLKPKELDIYIPSKQLAIEYCGIYWHSEFCGGKPKNYHRKKMDRSNSKNIRLITIFEDEYETKKEVVLSILRNAVGKSLYRIYARNTKVHELPMGVAKEFLNVNHLQGYSPCRFRYGLYKDNELVQVITFGSLTRKHSGKLHTVELKRLCSKGGYNIVGGFSKLLSYAIPILKSNGFENIKTYCDLRYANQFKTIYDTLNFSFVRESKYTPHYIKIGRPDLRYRNQTLKKTKEEKLSGKSELELRLEQGYDRIWDCGHRTYVLEI